MFQILKSVLREPWHLCRSVVDAIVLNYPNTPLGFTLRRKYYSFRGAQLEKNVRILKRCRISGCHLLKLGENSLLAEGVIADLGPQKIWLTIGKDTLIGPECYIRNMNHRFGDPKTEIEKQGHQGSDIVIGDGVWIGARCIILSGAKIGSHSVIAAGSVISFEVPPFSVAAGNPARVLKRRANPDSAEYQPSVTSI